MATLLPVTLSTASLLSLVYLALIVRLGRVRTKHRISIGDGGNAELLMHMRTQANFIEYVPLMLLLMALLEGAGANPRVLSVAGTLLILFRILHAMGMPRPAPNPFRIAGAGGTLVLLAAAGIWGLVIVLAA
jgi:uncharacterized membrane protein YecN with MAPEG domain